MAVTPVGYSRKTEGSSITKGLRIEAGWAGLARAEEPLAHSRL
jgi:hypothetical protein